MISSLTVGSGMVISYGCQSDPPSAVSMDSSVGIDFLNELGEIIIPKTNTPGAKDANVGEYIVLVVQDCFSSEEQLEFKSKISDFETACNQLFKRPFLDCSSEERQDLVRKLDVSDDGFKSLKGLITSAYLSSEIGQSQFFKYNPVPGKYDGCSDVRPW